jgi:hypothetical protein
MHARLTLCAIALLSLLTTGLIAGTNTTPATTPGTTPGGPGSTNPLLTCEESCEQSRDEMIQDAVDERLAAWAAAEAARDAKYAEAAAWEALCNNPGVDSAQCIAFMIHARQLREDANEAYREAAAAANREYLRKLREAEDWYDTCIAICNLGIT